MENLTKENFWNEMTEKYPKAMKQFCEWIDKYKEENRWIYLFGERRIVPSNMKGKIPDSELPSVDEVKAPKYHDLPLAMQFGIFIEFAHKIHIEYFTNSSLMLFEVMLFEKQDIQYKQIISSFLKDLQDKING